MYMYAAMADLAAELGDAGLKRACERLWDDVMASKLYVTAGLGPAAANEGFTEARLSPNGKEFAYVFRGEVFVTSMEGGVTKRITNTPWQERSVGFSPDGRSLVYAAERDESWNVWARKDYTSISPGALSDYLARKALAPAVRAGILERTRGILNRNYPVLEQWVGKRGDAFRLVPPRAGAIAYMRYAWPVNSLELVLRLRDEQSVLIVPGDHFGMDGFLRVGFGNEPEDLRGGLGRIDALLDSLATARTA